MKSAGKARNNGLYRHIRTSKEIIRNLLNDYHKRFQLTISSGVIKNYMGRQVCTRDACTHVQNLVYYNYGNTKVWRELLNAELQIG